MATHRTEPVFRFRAVPIDFHSEGPTAPTFQVKGPPIPGTSPDHPHPADPKGLVFDFDPTPENIARLIVAECRRAYQIGFDMGCVSINTRDAHALGRREGHAEGYAEGQEWAGQRYHDGYKAGQDAGLQAARVEYERNLPTHIRAAVLRMIHEHEAEIDALRSVLAGLPMLQPGDADTTTQQPE